MNAVTLRNVKSMGASYDSLTMNALKVQLSWLVILALCCQDSLPAKNKRCNEMTHF